MTARHGPSWVLRQLIRRYFSDGVSQSAAELSYFLLFSLCPLLMFLTSVLAQVNLSEDSILAFTRFLPDSVQSMISGYVMYLNSEPSIQPMVIGTILTLYFLSRAVRSLMGTVNQIYAVRRRSGWAYQFVLSLILTAGFLLAIIGTLALVVFGRTAFRVIRQWFPVPDVITNAVESASLPLAVAIIFFFVLVVNKIVPNVHLRWREAAPGAIFSFCFWILISLVFSFYVDHMARYSLLYGSLGAIIVLMLWLYLTSITLLLGAVLNHILMLRRSSKKPRPPFPHTQ